jgi:tetratricopeptide (TPR) repeat protein
MSILEGVHFDPVELFDKLLIRCRVREVIRRRVVTIVSAFLIIYILQEVCRLFSISPSLSWSIAVWIVGVLLLWPSMWLWLVNRSNEPQRQGICFLVLAGIGVVLLASMVVIDIEEQYQSLRIPLVVAALYFLVLLWLHWKRVSLARFVVWIGIVVFTLGTLAGKEMWTWHKTDLVGFKDDTIGILVASFEHDDGRYGSGFVDSLEEAFRQDPNLTTRVKIHQLDEPIAGKSLDAEFTRAAKIGARTHATMVVFGDVTNYGLIAKIAVIPPLDFVKSSEPLLFPPNRDQWPGIGVEGVHVVVEALMGTMQLYGGECNQAESSFADVQKQKSLSKLVIPEWVDYYEGLSVLCEVGRRGGNPHHAVALFEQSLGMTDGNASFRLLIALGLAYRKLADSENPTSNLEKAIQEYKRALQRLPEKGHSLWVSAINADIGVAYESLAAYQNPVQNLERAIAAEEESTKEFDPNQQLPVELAVDCNGLGVSYYKLARYEDRESNLMRAIDAYKRGLAGFSPSTLREEGTFAQLQVDLADAYRELAKTTGKWTYLDKAEAAVNHGLKFSSSVQYPRIFGEAEYQVGLIYMLRSTGPGDQFFAKGIGALACSVTILDRLNLLNEKFPAKYLAEARQSVGASQLESVLRSQENEIRGCSFATPAVLAVMQRWAPSEH